MFTVINSPQSLLKISGKSIFLAGTIDDGKSIDWQALLIDSVSELNVTILNPRRAEWDASWVQSIENTNFREQVEWELSALDLADFIFFYFASGSMSPVSLLELGLHAKSGKLVIVCPDGYWKKGNVDIVADRFSIPVFNDIESGIRHLKAKFL